METVRIVLGQSLSSEELEVINWHRLAEFNSKYPISPTPDNDDWGTPYFLVRQDGQLVAFARLHSIKIEFKAVEYDILGIATVIAIVKSKGYGWLLMGEMKYYIESHGKTAIGFCYPRVSAFYDKCGYSILSGGKGRFDFIDSGKKLPQTDSDDDVLYSAGEDGLMDEVLSNPRDKITAFKHPW